MRLETERLSLQPPRTEDAEDIVRHTDDEMIQRFTRVPAGQSVEDVIAWMREKEREREKGVGYVFVIRQKEDDTLVGVCGVEEINLHDRVGWLGFWIAAPHRGKGYATEATRCLVDHAFSQGLHKVCSNADLDNEASQRVLEKLGFVEEGLQKEQVYNGREWMDVKLYGLVRASRSS